MSKKWLSAALFAGLLAPLAACPKRPAVEPETPGAEAPAETASTSSAETPLGGEEILPDPGGDLDLEIDDSSAHGGSAHVHGFASLAANLEGGVLIIGIDSPLDNFGLPETAETNAIDETKLFDASIKIDNGASCQRTGLDAEITRNGDHGSVILTGTYTCSAPDDVTGVTFKGFAAYPDFEQINAIYIAPESSNAADLTPESPTLIFD